MSGFGSDPFGRDRFGTAAWSQAVLYDLLPGIYRETDEAGEHFLKKWADAIRPSFERVRDQISRWSDLREPLTVRTKYDDTTLLSLGAVRLPESAIEQLGVDGSVAGVGRAFTSPTARFSAKDLAKRLIISGSGIPANNIEVRIATVINTTTVVTDPPLALDAGPLRWQLKGFPDMPEGELQVEVRGGDVSRIVASWILFDGSSEFKILGRQQFFPFSDEHRHLTEQEGAGGQVLSDGRFDSGVSFTQKDVGKPLVISGSTIDSNNVKAQIFKVDPAHPSRVTLHEPLVVAGATINGTLTYTLRSGAAGVRVAQQAYGVSQPLLVSVADRDITVQLATDGTGTPISTANEVATAVAANVDANALVTVVAGGTGLGVVTAISLTPVLGTSLTQDAGPLTWALLPFPQLTLATTAPPAGVVEQEGVDLAISGSPGNTVLVPSGRFTAADVGKLFTIRGSLLGSDGAYPIAAVVDLNHVTITAPTTLSAESGLTWEVRTPSTFPDATQVEARASSLIEFLAADFALTIEHSDTEAQQRSWIENCVRWMDLKGSEKAYQIIGSVSDVNATPVGLYRITRELSQAIPSAHVFLVEDTRSGTDGRIFQVGFRIRFTSPSVTFHPYDQGRNLVLQNTAGGNDGLYEIAEVIDAHTIEFTLDFLPSAPDNGTAGTLVAPTIHWQLGRLYTDLAPLRARFDTVNTELMQEIVGNSHFLVDSFCWETAFIEEFTIAATNVTPGASLGPPTYFTIELTGVFQPSTGVFSTAQVIVDPSAWQFTDSNNVKYYVESVPVLTSAGPPEVCTLKVFATTPPALGVGKLGYICDEITNCNYCRSSSIALTLQKKSTLVPDVALQTVTTRTENEIKPAHVSLVVTVKPPPVVASRVISDTVTGTDDNTVTVSGGPAPGPALFVVDTGKSIWGPHPSQGVYLTKLDVSDPSHPKIAKTIDLSAAGQNLLGASKVVGVDPSTGYVFVGGFGMGAASGKPGVTTQASTVAIVDPVTMLVVGILSVSRRCKAIAFDGLGNVFTMAGVQTSGQTFIQKWSIATAVSSYPSSPAATATWNPPHEVESMTYGGGYLWLSTGSSGPTSPGKLTRMDPSAGTTATYQLASAGHIWGLLYAFGSIWASNSDYVSDARIYRFDPGTFPSAPVSTVTLPGGLANPTQMVADAQNTIWVSNGGSGYTDGNFITRISTGLGTEGVLATVNVPATRGATMGVAYDPIGDHVWSTMRNGQNSSEVGVQAFSTGLGTEALVTALANANPFSIYVDPISLAFSTVNPPAVRAARLTGITPILGVEHVAMSGYADESGGVYTHGSGTVDPSIVNAAATTITLHGSGFQSPGFSLDSLQIIGVKDGTPVSTPPDNITVVSDTQITFTVPNNICNVPPDVTQIYSDGTRGYGPYVFVSASVSTTTSSGVVNSTDNKLFLLRLKRPPLRTTFNDTLWSGIGAGFPFQLFGDFGNGANLTVTLKGSPTTVEFAGDGGIYATPSGALASDGLIVVTEYGEYGTDQPGSPDATQHAFVYNVSPWHGPKSGGTSITITGKGFLSNPFVNVAMGDLRRATGVTVVNDTTITCTSPPLSAAQDAVVGSGGSGNNVDVVLNNGGSPEDSVGGKDFFIYDDFMATPDNGTSAGGVSVTMVCDVDYFFPGDVPVFGGYYVLPGGGLSVFVTYGVGTNVTVTNPRTLTFTTPPMWRGAQTIRIMDLNGNVRGGAFGKTGTFIFT